MRNLSFVLWVVLWPLAVEICGYLNHLQNKILSKADTDGAMVINFLIWVIVAWLVYEREPKKEEVSEK